MCAVKKSFTIKSSLRLSPFPWNFTGAASAKEVMMYLFEFRAASLDHDSDSSVVVENLINTVSVQVNIKVTTLKISARCCQVFECCSLHFHSKHSCLIFPTIFVNFCHSADVGWLQFLELMFGTPIVVDCSRL